MSIKNVAGTIGKAIGDHSQQILAVVSVCGVALTAVEASKATLKARDILEAEENSKDRDLTFKEKVKLAGPCYIRTGVAFAITSAAIIGSATNAIHNQALLAASANIAERRIDILERKNEKLRDAVGDKAKVKEAEEKASEEHVREMGVPDERFIIQTPGGSHLFFDPLSGRWFRSSQDWLNARLNEVNNILFNENWITLNQLYSQCDLPSVELGEETGFNSMNGQIYFDFSRTNNDSPTGEPYTFMEFSYDNRPSTNYQDV